MAAVCEVVLSTVTIASVANPGEQAEEQAIREQLRDDVDDRSGGQGDEGDADGLGGAGEGGPPPIKARVNRNAQLDRRGVPSVFRSPASLADGEAFGEVVQSDAHGYEQREPLGG